MKYAVSAICALMVASPALAQNGPPRMTGECILPPGVFIHTLKELPPQLVAALGRIADRGEAFNSSDVIFPNSPPSVRFIRAYQRGAQWLVWTEHGGIAHSYRLRVFEPGAPYRVVSNEPVGKASCSAAEIIKAQMPPPDPTLPEKMQRAQNAFDTFKFEDALEIYSEIIAGNANNADAFERRAMSYLALGRHAQALADYDRVLELKSQWLTQPGGLIAKVLYGRGLAKRHLGDVEGAREDIDAALARNPNVPLAFEHYATGAIPQRRIPSPPSPRNPPP